MEEESLVVGNDDVGYEDEMDEVRVGDDVEEEGGERRMIAPASGRATFRARRAPAKIYDETAFTKIKRRVNL